MALIACGDCGREISDAAPTCPHCGRPANGRATGQHLAVQLLSLVLMVVGIGMFVVMYRFWAAVGVWLAVSGAVCFVIALFTGRRRD